MGIMGIPVPEGYCNTDQCNSVQSTFVNAGGSGYTICGRSFSNTTPIKQLIKGSMTVPWVRLRFEGDKCPPAAYATAQSLVPPSCVNESPTPSAWDYTEITTGNVSQPGNKERCRAVIKSFNYAWGSTQSGAICKIIIHDESGDSFSSWFWRVIKNPLVSDNRSGHSVYKMKVTFGWLIVGGEGDACPAEVVDGIGTATTCASNPRLICSPAIWFLPTNLTTTMQNGKFIYELEGADLLRQGQMTPRSEIFGNDRRKTHFVDAVAKLGMTGIPPFNVQFLQLEDGCENDVPQPLQFHKRKNVTTGWNDFSVLADQGIEHSHYVDDLGAGNYKPCVGVDPSLPPILPTGACPGGLTSFDDLKYRGPLGIYRCNRQDPIAAINDWITQIRADTVDINKDGKGITINYDSTYVVPSELEHVNGLPTKGRLLIWADSGAGSIRSGNVACDARKKALYIVNGGSCSAVYSFTPSIKWHPLALIAGGGTSPNSGEMFTAAATAAITAAGTVGDALRGVGGPSFGVLSVAPPNHSLDAGIGATQNAIRAAQENVVTNTLHNVVEAELRVQGDPSLWLCSPFHGTGRTVAIVVINPFYLQASNNACPGWSQKSVCNDVLTNRNWLIESVEHSIKEGSYVTIIKVKLFGPLTDTPAVGDDGEPIGFSGDADSVSTRLCEAGTTNCALSNQTGGLDVQNGIGEAFLQFGMCSENLSPTEQAAECLGDVGVS